MRKGMRLCTHVRLHLGIAKHLRRNGIMGTTFTPDGMLKNMAYTYKRKHECSVLLLDFGEFKCKDYIAMLFLLTLSLSKADAKLRRIIESAKNNLLMLDRQ